MEKNKYIGHSVDELIENQEFVALVKSIQTKEAWEQFLQLNETSKKNIIEAREIIVLFDTNDGILSKDKKYNLWKSIKRYDQEYYRKRKAIKLKTYIKVAASIVVLLSLGSLLYIFLNQDIQQYNFADIQEQTAGEAPILVLSNGEQVNLQNNNPNLTILKDQNAIQIDNDSIVNNEPIIDDSTKKVRLNELIIPFGTKSQLSLSDGTKVWLNAGSKLAFPQKFDGKRREVFLDGEAYFEVAKNEKQPFIISANNIDIRVLGTKFNVSAYQSDNLIETVLLEGSVSISEKGNLIKDKVVMVPNQKTVYNKTKKNIEVESVSDAEIYTVWINGWYEFSNVSLQQTFMKLERYYNVKFEYDQSSISRALPVSGKLDLKDSLDVVMEVLSGVSKIKYKIDENRVIINN